MPFFFSCHGKKSKTQLENELHDINLTRGDIALCTSSGSQFGAVGFNISCAEKVKANFSLALSLLHSFEYTEAEKIFAKVVDADPECVMAYWGIAMCNFHPLWAPPGKVDLQKGLQIINLARSVKSKSPKESEYLEAIATIYDHWEELDQHTRTVKFEKASAQLYKKYPDDNEAAIFYALSLRATADPKDKTFRNQKKAGKILDAVLIKEPNHPGIAHYIIHNYDYPELAALGLDAARKYAAIAAASAHAQHMPSHIFTRLGLWDESTQANLKSIAAAQCYAQNIGINGHWDEELHGIDYLVYAYLQQAKDEEALEQVKYLSTINTVFPVNFKDAYTFATVQTRYALERKDWMQAANLELKPTNFPWDKFPWERANLIFGRTLGEIHIHQLLKAKKDIEELRLIQNKLQDAKEFYKSNLVQIQVMTSEAWLDAADGKRSDAVALMTTAADSEDATEKDPVTPGEVIPARELLGDLYLQQGEPQKALHNYETSLKRHPNRFNCLFGAAQAKEKLGDTKMASFYYRKLLEMASSKIRRSEQKTAESFIAVHHE